MVPYNQLKPHQLPPFIKLKNADGKEDIHYSVFYDGVPDEIKNIALIELNETEEKKRNGMQRLRERLKEEEISGVDDNALLCCLRKCKYNLKKAETQLLRFVKIRKEVIDDLRKVDIKKIEHVLDYHVVGILPYRDKEGRTIFFTSPNFNLDLFDVEEAALCFYLTLEFIWSFPLSSVVGAVYIGEAKTPNTQIMYSVMKTLRRQLGRLISLPGRISSIEVLNEMSIVRWTVNIIKPFISGKIVDRINFYGSDVINLRKSYHPDLLPEEFSGTMGPISNKFYKEEILNYIKKVKDENMTSSSN